MKYGRANESSFGRTHCHVFPIDLRRWQLGGFDWGDVDPVIVVIPVLVMPHKIEQILQQLQQTLCAELHTRLRKFYRTEVAVHIRGPY